MQRRLPAEWEPVHAVMLTWPHREGDWAATFPAIHACYLGLVRAIQPHADLIISANDATLAELVKQDLDAAGIVLDNIAIYITPSNDTWVRDHGPITVFEGNDPVLLDFTFNGWGGKYPADDDNRVTSALYHAGAFDETDFEQVDFILEGGSIESDGQGTLLTTTSCLLSATRNAALDRDAIEQALHEHLGVERVLWLTHSELAGDDTDGHIDMLARFCDPQTIVYTACNDENDVNYASLAAMQDELQALRDNQGRPYRLVPLPMPAPLFTPRGDQLPASYANFLILNRVVLVPQYDTPADRVALDILQGCFPEHDMVGVPCRALIEQFGSLHCATMQLPG